MRTVQRAKQLLGFSTKEEATNIDTYIHIRWDGKLQRVDFNDVCWIEIERNGIWFYTETNRFIATLSINDLEARLPQNRFIRVHKLYIIAINQVEVINKDIVCIRRQGKFQEILIGDTFRKEFIMAIENKIMKK